MSSARAQAAAAEPVRVTFEAPEGCPDQATFETTFLAQLGTATLAQAGELARTLDIRVTRDSQSFRAEVELVDRDAQRVARVIQAPTCEQAVETIALVAALAVRAQAERSGRSEGGPAAATPPEASAPSEASADEAGAGRTEQPVAKAKAASPAPSPPRPAPPAKNQGKGPFGVALSAGALVTGGVGPVAAFGAVVEARLGTTSAPTHSLALLASYADTFRTSVDGVEVRMRLFRARLEACPFEPHLSEHASVSPCAGFELGSQSGEAFDDPARVSNAEPAARLWSALTLAARARFRWGKLGVALGPELVFPLTRNKFLLVRPELPLYEVPGVAAGASAVVGIVW